MEETLFKAIVIENYEEIEQAKEQQEYFAKLGMESPVSVPKPIYAPKPLIFQERHLKDDISRFKVDGLGHIVVHFRNGTIEILEYSNRAWEALCDLSV